MDYQVSHLDQDSDSYNKAVEAGCPEKASFKDCRKNMLAAQPILDDMKEQREALLAAWNAENNDRTIPASCREAMDAYESSMADYWAIEARVLQVYRSVNPDSTESIRSAVPQFQEIGKQEDAIVLTYQNSAKKVAQVFTTPECQSY